MSLLQRGFRWLAVAGSTLLPVACDSGGVVGGECRSGLTPCDGRCVDLLTDSDNCGACGVGCPAGRTCRDGEYCEALGPATAEGGGAAGSSGAAGAQGWPGGGRGGAGPGTGGATAGGAGSGCNPPFNTAEHCGDCDTTCAEPNPLCACDAGSCSCVAGCDARLTQCNNSCVDLQADPQHCGSCGHECPTRLCQSGTCVGAVPGHVVLLCASFRQAHQTHPQTVLLGNAVFLSGANPARVLTYQRYAHSVAATNVVATLNWAAESRGRLYSLVATDSADEITRSLSIVDHDVLLVLDQPDAPSSELAVLGADWATPLDRFIRAGGTVIVLDSGTGTAEMSQLITSAQLVDVDAENPITYADLLHNRAPSDSVAVNVLSPYRPLADSCTFETSQPPDSTTVFAITDAAQDQGNGAPSVIHLVRGL